jgi:hypothetical protein
MNKRAAVITDHAVEKPVRGYLPQRRILVEIADDLPA